MQRSPINGADSNPALEKGEVLSSGFSRFRCHSPVHWLYAPLAGMAGR
ncbi:MAG TPA: hypothetical protein VH186_01080 [Chloroflexia bacterium]|nr:hypothetical protein [Chloroflexia bacterium]